MRKERYGEDGSGWDRHGFIRRDGAKGISVGMAPLKNRGGAGYRSERNGKEGNGVVLFKETEGIG